MCTGCWGPLHKVYCMGSAFICTGFACFADAVVNAGTEGVVVLKGVAVSGTMGVILGLYWHCIALCLFHMLFSIWNMFDVLLGVPLTVPFHVLTLETVLDVLMDVPFGVPFPVLSPFILLKCGTLSPFTTISYG